MVDFLVAHMSPTVKHLSRPSDLLAETSSASGLWFGDHVHFIRPEPALDGTRPARWRELVTNGMLNPFLPSVRRSPMVYVATHLHISRNEP
jgi:hypothetical protein